MSELPPIFESTDSIVTQCRDCDFPGYLILRPRQSATRFGEVPLFAQELGPLLSILEEQIIKATGAAHVYVLRFSEAQGSVHFHLFPRTKDIADEYAKTTGGTSDQVNGPELFEWVRRRTRVTGADYLSPRTVFTARVIREAMHITHSLKSATFAPL
jgi:diadenosine tetraphosphate (Ap4A) HIT family hydrolase